MNREDAAVPARSGAIAAKLADVVDAVVTKLRGGGRLIYVGAGTSGPSPRSTRESASRRSRPSRQVLALVAGAELPPRSGAMLPRTTHAAGTDAIRSIEVSAGDAVIGISASGAHAVRHRRAGTAAATAALTACGGPQCRTQSWPGSASTNWPSSSA